MVDRPGDLIRSLVRIAPWAYGFILVAMTADLVITISRHLPTATASIPMLSMAWTIGLVGLVGSLLARPFMLARADRLDRAEARRIVKAWEEMNRGC